MFDGNDGGFFNETGGFAQGGTTPKPGGKVDTKRAQNILPVTTRQILNCSESGITIAGTDFYLVTLVGRVTAIDNTSLKVTYTIEDDRGSIEAVHWVEQDNDLRSPVVEDVLCRVHGSIRSQENKKFLMVFNIRPLKNLNELTTHRLEVATHAKKVELASANAGQKSDMDMDMNGGNSDLGNSLMNMGGGGGGWSKAPMSHQQKLVFGVIKRFTQDPGVHVEQINDYLPEKIPQNQINKIVDDLMNEGHIYSSIDEYHFLCTENA